MNFISLAFTAIIAGMMSITVPNNNSDIQPLANESEQVSYSVNQFSSLPIDWELYSKSDVGGTTTTYENNEMVITHKNPSINNSLYYGTVYYVNTDNIWKDFTFEVTLKMLKADDQNRWVGLGYRTQEVAGGMVGYLMGYRQNGNSHYSAVNSSKAFNDGETLNPNNIKLSDGNYHTLKVVMEGNTASHYIDNKLITSWDIRDRNTHLGGSSLDAGGLAILLNRATVSIKSVNVVGTLSTLQNIEKDETIVNTYRDDLGLINFPTVITDVKTENRLYTLLDTDTRPSNAILHVNDDLDVIVNDGTEIDTLTNVINDYLEKSIIPVVYIKNELQADRFIELMNEKLIIDMAVMSNDASLIKRIKDVHSVIRGIYHVTEATEPIEMVYEANRNYAGVIALNQDLVNRETVTYLHARFKTVWVMQQEETDFALYNSINSGCYGMIVDDYENLYAVYGTYESNTLTRTPFNVAHRGLSAVYNENSVLGTEKAISTGATHVEIDIFLTTDNEIVCMHNDTIDDTTNGTGKIESYSLEELREFYLDVHSPYEPIPTLEDISVPIKESDAVLIIEIKSNKIKIVEILAEQLERLELTDQVVVISFNTGILGEMKDLIPEVPTANLGEARTSNFVAVLYWMGTYNTGINTHYTHINKNDNMYFLRDRGIMGWYWIYETSPLMDAAVHSGIIGITNNSCNYFFQFIKNVEGISFTLESGQDIEKATFKLNVTAYDGFEEVKTGELFSYDDKGDYYEVICSYKTIFANRVVTLYTEKFEVKKAPEDIVKPSDPVDPIEPNEPINPNEPSDPVVPNEPKNISNGLIIGLICGTVGVSGIVTTIVILSKKGILSKLISKISKK